MTKTQKGYSMLLRRRIGWPGWAIIIDDPLGKNYLNLYCKTIEKAKMQYKQILRAFGGLA